MTMTTKLESFLSMSANAASIKGSSIVDDTTSVTESVTEASSARSTIITHALTPQELINNNHQQQGADPFDYTSVSAATDLDEDVNGVERVWFSSVSNRFSRFCIQETSTENIEGASSSDIAVKTPEQEEEEREAEESNNSCNEKNNVERQTTNSPVAAPKRKRVSFNESLNQCHEDAQQVMTLEEQEEYWYEKEMLDVFAENAALTCQVLVLNQPERAETFLQSYNKCCKTTSMAQQSKHHHHHGHHGHHGGLVSERDLRRLLHYRHKVQLLYQAENNLSGLEHAVLGAIRGDPKSLRHFVLDHTKAFQERQGLTDAEQKRSIMAHFSACLSQPTQLLAHEMAVAFHTSLRLEEQQQQQSRQQQQ